MLQVANANDQGAAPHVVRLIAVDAPRHADQAHPNTDPELHSDNLSLMPAQAQQSLDAHASMNAATWQDDTAYIPPSLAFNLGLQYQLWPLMAQAQLQTHSDTPHVPSGNVANCQQIRHGHITINPLQDVPPHLRTIQLSQSGESVHCTDIRLLMQLLPVHATWQHLHAD